MCTPVAKSVRFPEVFRLVARGSYVSDGSQYCWAGDWNMRPNDLDPPAMTRSGRGARSDHASRVQRSICKNLNYLQSTPKQKFERQGSYVVPTRSTCDLCGGLSYVFLRGCRKPSTNRDVPGPPWTFGMFPLPLTSCEWIVLNVRMPEDTSGTSRPKLYHRHPTIPQMAGSPAELENVMNSVERIIYNA